MRSLIISRPDRVGDVVISTSCLAPIKEKYPAAKIYFVAEERMRPLLDSHPLLAGFLPLGANLTEAFRKVEASAIVHLHPNADCYAAAQRAGVPVRIGYGISFQNRELTHAIRDRRAEGLRHEGEYNFDLLRPMGVKPPEKLSANVCLSEESRRSLQDKLPWPLETTRYAMVHTAAHSKIARWAEDRFLRLAERVRTQFGLLPVFVGVEKKDFTTRLASEHLNLTGNTDLGELGWLLKCAQVVITNDSGPGHLAAAVGTPLVVIFGRSAPRYGPTRWRPLTEKAIVVAKIIPRKFLEGRDAYWRRCFADITVEEVEEAVREALSLQAKKRFRISTKAISV